MGCKMHRTIEEVVQVLRFKNALQPTAWYCGSTTMQFGVCTCAWTVMATVVFLAHSAYIYYFRAETLLDFALTHCGNDGPVLFRLLIC